MVRSLQDELVKLVDERLDKAERTWGETNGQLAKQESRSMAMESALTVDSAPSRIPGHPWVNDGETIVDEFIVLFADMRDSSKHLREAVSPDRASVSYMQRVFYETSALLPAIAKTIEVEGGSVTEYLGDGVLAMFRVDSKNKDQAIYASYRSSRNIVGESLDIVNYALNRRYRLPKLEVGVGLAISKALVTLVGINNDMHPKVIGEAVYKASKLAFAKNKVLVDKDLRHLWPQAVSGQKGTVQFTETPSIRDRKLAAFEVKPSD